MCTAIKYNCLFGRNLDLWCSFGESVVVTPRNYINNRYAMIGMAAVRNDYPLYYEASNEKGLGMAGLNFPGNAVYYPESKDKNNIPPYELIPYILGSCDSTDEAEKVLYDINIVKKEFSPELPLSPLHWIIADSKRSIVAETTKNGMRVYNNPINVLTNSPAFDIQKLNLCNYRKLSPTQPKNRFSHRLELPLYSNGMGAIGLPGDCSSMSRFVRAAFFLHNSPSEDSKKEQLSHFFRLLVSVSMPKGSVLLPDGTYEYTRYSSCCDLESGIYYYISYHDLGVRSIRLCDNDLDSDRLILTKL